MHNEVIADAFIPAGGRPQTIHAGNWQAFSRDGKPSSRVIVEGANLFITPEARTELSLSERANERIAPTFQSRTWRGSSRALWRRGSCTAGVAFLGSLPEARLAELAVAYLEQEHETEALVAAVRASSMPDKERIAALLALGGTRAALQLS